jgi:hypothetical protein
MEKWQNNNILTQKISTELADIFWIDSTKDDVHKILNSIEQEKKEINSNELQLAKIFWKYEEMMALNNQSFTVASVMKDYEEYEQRVA